MHLLLKLQLLVPLIIIIIILFQELLLDDCQHENDEGNNHTQTETVGIKKMCSRDSPIFVYLAISLSSFHLRYLHNTIIPYNFFFNGRKTSAY